MRDVSHVRFVGLSMEVARGNAWSSSAGAKDAVVSCTLRNIGNRAVTIDHATESGVEGCDIAEAGDGGVTLTARPQDARAGRVVCVEQPYLAVQPLE
jgi:hypothetical protein